jgi:signal transduction histidine kinase
MRYLMMLFILLQILSCEKMIDKDDALVKDMLQEFLIHKNEENKSMLQFVKRADSILSQKDNNTYKGINNYIKGSYFNITSNFQLALKFLNDVEPNLKEFKKYDSIVAASYLAKSNVYTNMGNFSEGIKAALDAKEIFEKINSSIGISAANISIAKIYQAKGEIDKAKQILKQNESSKDEILKLKSLHILANIFGEKGEIDSAIQIDNVVIEKYKNSKYIEGISPFYNNKALCLNEKKLFDSAIIYFRKSFYIDSIRGSVMNMAANYNDMGDMYLQQNDLEKAKFYLQKSLVLSKQVGRKPTELFCYKNLSAIYRKTKNYEKALAYADTMKIVQKELDNVAVNTGIEELNLVYETSKKEKQIQNQKITILKKNVAIIGTIVFFALALLLLYYNNRKQKLKQQLERIVLQQENEKAILSAEETERQRISKDLHDNMGAYTSALLANVEKLKQNNIEDAELAKMKTNAEQILSSLRETIWVLNNKEISVQDFSDSFTTYCFKILKNFEKINFEVETEITENNILSAPVAIHLNKILQEIFQNCIKHSECSVLKYTILSDKFITITLADNGKGFNNEEKKYGNGLENIKWRAKQIDAQIKIITHEGNGTTINITK